jgi:hypothetical protein
MWEYIFSTALGIIIGTFIVMLLGALFTPILFKLNANRIIRQLSNIISTNESKGTMRLWFEETIRDGMRDVVRDHITEEVIKNGITDALNDKNNKKIVNEMLDFHNNLLKKS